jgi:hypothetical protein
MIPAKFGFIWPSSFRREVFLTLTNQKKECKILYKASSFGSIRPTNMAAKSNSFF